MRYRRLARDYKRRIGDHEAMIYWATVLVMTKRLTPTKPGSPHPDDGAATARAGPARTKRRRGMRAA
jgi:hypothetical protein